MKIIKISKKDSKNVIINFDDGRVLFLSYEVFLKSGIKKNDELSEDRFLFLIKENQRFAVKQSAFKYLGRRLHSKNELRIKLLQKKYDPEIIKETLNDLQEKKYLDDHEFARLFSEENIKNKKWGKNKLSAELSKKRIDRKIISEIISSAFDNEDESKNAMDLAFKKMKTLSKKNLDKNKLREKLYSSLSLKGYNYDIIKNTVDKILTDIDR